MGKRSIPIVFREDPKVRNVTLRKRTFGLIKKAHELAILCGCNVSVIIKDLEGNYSSFSNHSQMDSNIREFLGSDPNIVDHKNAEDFLNFNESDLNYRSFQKYVVDNRMTHGQIPSFTPNLLNDLMGLERDQASLHNQIAQIAQQVAMQQPIPVATEMPLKLQAIETSELKYELPKQNQEVEVTEQVVLAVPERDVLKPVATQADGPMSVIIPPENEDNTLNPSPKSAFNEMFTPDVEVPDTPIINRSRRLSVPDSFSLIAPPIKKETKSFRSDAVGLSAIGHGENRFFAKE
ncbi:hypothetical protein PCE1_004418 [Barthelona sp. PCE]